MQFGRYLPRILQAIWETDTAEGPVWVSKLYVTDAYQHGSLQPYQVGAFVYVVPLAPEDDDVIICIDMVPPMGWVDSPKLFCDFLETLTAMGKTLFDTALTATAYGAITKILATGPPPPSPIRTRESPILTVIWMPPYLWYRVDKNANTEALMAQLFPSNLSYNN